MRLVSVQRGRDPKACVRSLEIAGSGGHSDPRKREREDVERDLREGLITEKEAREVFGLEPEALT